MEKSVLLQMVSTDTFGNIISLRLEICMGLFENCCAIGQWTWEQELKTWNSKVETFVLYNF